MSRECAVCGKNLKPGHNVSHSNSKSNRTFKPNLQSISIITDGSKKKALVCTRCIRTGKIVKAV